MQKLLVIRNDKLGDFMLIFPALALLKQAMPNLEITALVPAYTASLAELCPYIDKVILDIDSKDKQGFKSLVERIKQENFYAVINFYLTWHNAKLSFLSGIKQRFAPATKAFQFLCNQRIKQRRSQSLKPEYEYNIDLAKAFLHSQKVLAPKITPPYLTFSQTQIASQKQKLAKQWNLSAEQKLVFLHCGTGGSAKPLTLEQNAEINNAYTGNLAVHDMNGTSIMESKRSDSFSIVLVAIIAGTPQPNPKIIGIKDSP